MQKYIFILGHMRSYSTLLSHILGSHPSISGYAELHQSYNSLTDFQEMYKRISFAYDKKINSNFLLDKILHNQYKINKDIINSSQTHLIVLLRKPDDSINSILRLYKNPKWYKDPSSIINYYIRRVQKLEKISQQTNKPILFIESEQIIENSTKTLSKIENFLDLKNKLSSNYEIFKLTGKRRYGDMSPELYKGEIDKVKKNKFKIILPKPLLYQAEEIYKRAKEKLLLNSV